MSAADLDPGPHPDLVDRDGDRWYEVAGGRYEMEVPGRSPRPPGEGVLRASIEANAGPVFEVPRRVDRGPTGTPAAQMWIAE